MIGADDPPPDEKPPDPPVDDTGVLELMVTVTAFEVVMFPAASCAVAVIE